ncbi:MAG: hypothetical protein M3437_14465 [Chloroflexota bacterium]|nr:hypothetical protein [Chloroflexota bacterium]
MCDRLEATMVMRANGFERKIEKATASGRKVVINEYFPPETAAGKFLLQHRRPEVFASSVRSSNWWASSRAS